MKDPRSELEVGTGRFMLVLSLVERAADDTCPTTSRARPWQWSTGVLSVLWGASIVREMTWLTLAFLAATPPPVKLAAPGLAGVELSAELTTFYGNHLAQQLALNESLAIITASDVASLLGVERQKQLLGCGDESCVAELANALGVDGLITGSLGRFGDFIQVNLKVIAAADGRTLALYSGSASGESQALDTIKDAARALSVQVLTRLGRGVAPVGARRFFWIPLVASALGVGLGLGLFGIASADAAALRGLGVNTPPLSTADAHRHLTSGVAARTGGIVAFAAAGVGLLVAGALWLFGAPVALVPTAQAGAVELWSAVSLP